MSEGNNDKINNSKKSKSKLILIIVAILIITNCSSLLLGNYLASRGRYFTSVSNKVENSSELMSDTKKYESLFMVRDTLLKKYDGEINDDALLEGAIKGMTNALGDPYTVFLNSEEFDKLMKESQGSLDGIGVQVGAIENKIVIIAPIKDSPSDKAGLLSGDIIEKIDGTVYSGEQLNEAVSYITSPERDQVKLTIKRKDENSFEVKVKKEEIKIKSLEGEMVNSNIGYIKIDTFMNENTASDFKDKIKELEDKGMKGLILDLRNNPGGLLSEAIGVASQFIPKDNVITYTIDKYENKNESLSVGGIAQGMPLVVLVDNGSASASEVVTGALRDYKAATIVGKTTFGKGIVQQPFKFKNGIGGLKVTVSKYYTPNGENIHKKGITPDFEVEITEDINKADYDKSKDEQLNFAIEKIKEKI
ncbi:S41 family peptidase [uncultured Clostridium sp.]|uniref:S41 family peptidase n=1 Tax=uncultured Clostridium sp. TaxID=59620 RepID=UPI002589AAD7|nr:S41 family peptidase [uncultured Clostridium sp.]